MWPMGSGRFSSIAQRVLFVALIREDKGVEVGSIQRGVLFLWDPAAQRWLEQCPQERQVVGCDGGPRPIRQVAAPQDCAQLR